MAKTAAPDFYKNTSIQIVKVVTVTRDMLPELRQTNERDENDWDAISTQEDFPWILFLGATNTQVHIKDF